MPNPFVSGKEQILRKLGITIEQLERNVEEGLLDAGEFLKDRSVEIAPVETGKLRESAHSTPEVRDGFKTVIVVGYRAIHSVIQHEMFEIKRTPGTEWKYLEAPARRYRKEIFQIVAEKAKEVR